MTEQTQEAQAQADDSGTNGADELTLLKQRASMLGISFSNNIKVDSLRAKIEEKLNQDDEKASQEAPASDKPQTRAQIVEEMHAAQMKLVRVRITNMDPKKKDLPGEIFTVANEFLGTVRKYVPYGEQTDEGYHIPFCIYQQLEERRFLNIRTKRDPATGHIKTTQSWAKEFALELMEPLTEEELKQLATAQIAAGSVSADAADNFMS